MLYTFRGGPLNGERLDVTAERIQDGTYNHVTVGDYKSAFHILPEMTHHRYMAVGEEMIYLEPDKLT